MSIFMTPRQVAERWGCSPELVQRLCKSGQLPAMQIGQVDAAGRRMRWRIAVATVERYEQAHTNEPATVPNNLGVSTSANATVAVPAGFDLPPGYVPVFPELWGMTQEEAASRAAGRGRSPKTKKSAAQR